MKNASIKLAFFSGGAKASFVGEKPVSSLADVFGEFFVLPNIFRHE